MRSAELFERITEAIIAGIEAGASTYRMPWHRWGRDLAQPINAFSARPYRGINTLMLWATGESAGHASGRWATLRQWSDGGARVRKGEKGTPVLFWKKPGIAPREAADEVQDQGSRMVSRVYWLFNADQVDNAPAGPDRHSLSPASRIEAASRFVCRTGANIRHGGDEACYLPHIDQIWLPHFEQFRDAESYYAVLAHECVHWSGASFRLDRDLKGRFGDEAYAMEELIAELGAAFIAGQLGIASEPRPDHAAYIASWLKVLQHDRRAILTASSRAQEAVDYLSGFSSAREVAPSLSPAMLLSCGAAAVRALP